MHARERPSTRQRETPAKGHSCFFDFRVATAARAAASECHTRRPSSIEQGYDGRAPRPACPSDRPARASAPSVSRVCQPGSRHCRSRRCMRAQGCAGQLAPPARRPSTLATLGLAGQPPGALQAGRRQAHSRTRPQSWRRLCIAVRAPPGSERRRPGGRASPCRSSAIASPPSSSCCPSWSAKARPPSVMT